MVGREVDVARLILGGNSLESSRGNKGIFISLYGVCCTPRPLSVQIWP